MAMKLDFDLAATCRNVQAVAFNLLSPDELAKHRRVVIQFPVSNLSAAMESIGDVRSDLIAPQQLAKFLLAVTHLCAHPYLCTPMADADQRSPADESIYKNGMQPSGGEVVAPRVLVHFELVRDTSGAILAYRYFFDVQDAAMDLDQGIEAMIRISSGASLSAKGRQKQQERRKYLHTTQEATQFWDVSIQSRAEYLDAFLGVYNSHALAPRFKLLPLNTPADKGGASIYDFAGPKHCTYLCQFRDMANIRGAQATLWAADPADATRQGTTPYYNAQTRRYTFPHPEDVFRIPANQVAAVFFFHCRFPHITPPERAWPVNYPQLERHVE